MHIPLEWSSAKMGSIFPFPHLLAIFLCLCFWLTTWHTPSKWCMDGIEFTIAYFQYLAVLDAKDCHLVMRFWGDCVLMINLIVFWTKTRVVICHMLTIGVTTSESDSVEVSMMKGFFFNHALIRPLPIYERQRRVLSRFYIFPPENCFNIMVGSNWE